MNGFEPVTIFKEQRSLVNIQLCRKLYYQLSRIKDMRSNNILRFKQSRQHLQFLSLFRITYKCNKKILKMRKEYNDQIVHNELYTTDTRFAYVRKDTKPALNVFIWLLRKLYCNIYESPL